ncbi:MULTISPECIES: MFS transporter [unclassified Pseudomonas]|uniref:MFS transporter n=1 Tax=unclassified Pseudomonas TaxID=196821 RepID=UPI000DA9CFDF|nr:MULTISPECIES: MFS transporter [unclassified Pseudomonas]MDW3716513.1 MFS transporter [Pseudomonas sp. 2023EL-01195]PZE11599.1 MFS transporter [Pseudomonas sp. 57B-090624]
MSSSHPPGNRWLILLVVVLAYLPIVIDMTVLHIAVPSLTLSLGASGEQVLWIIDIYPLIMAGLLVPMGTLADRIGSRFMLLAGLLVFVAMSCAAAYAPTAAALIAARAGMAVGGAMVLPCTLAIIRRAFESPRERGIALGLWGTVASAGAALGPLVGGALLEHYWWGSVFLINLPLMAIIWPLAHVLVPRDAGSGSGGWKIGQALLLIAGIIASVHALKSGLTPGGPSWASAATLLLGLALLADFVRRQLTSAEPMLDLGLFARPAIRSGLIMALVVSGALAGTELTIAQELQLVLGRTPLQAGLFLLPLMIAAGVGGPLAGYLVALVGLRRVATTTLLCSAVALAGLGLSDLNDGAWVAGLLVLLGLALSIGLTASSIAIMGAAPASKAGAAGALEATGYEMGTGLGITAFGVLLSSVYAAAIQLPGGVPEAVKDPAMRSLADTLVTAERLDATLAASLAQAGREAFAAAHGTVLLSAAVLLAGLALVVFLSLGKEEGREPAAAGR